ncbi:probable efflux protein Cj0309c [Campylobacter upsaliensis RM3195]|nr:probable efflux protein Cj0309c [Campylobacter upsaliensis RM3195]
MREISMATAYAIWTGIGAAGGVIVSVVFFKESKSLMKLFFLGLILASSVGLKWIS